MAINNSDFEQMKEQTIKWCMTIPNSKKNINNMRLTFVNNKAVFVPAVFRNQQ